MRPSKSRRPTTLSGPESFESRIVLSAQAPDYYLDYLPWTDDAAQADALLNAVDTQAGLDQARSDFGFTGVGQTVAVLDTGIAWDHPALGGGFGTGYQVVGGWDFSEEWDAVPYDDGPAGSHGTHVAGIIGSNDSTYTGVAPGVDLVALRVFNDQGQGYFQWVEQALQWVYDNRDTFRYPITTVNLSLGAAYNGSQPPSWAMLEDEFSLLHGAGIFIAVAAGNSFGQYQTPGLAYPAASPYVVPVMSVDADGQLSYYSQRHPRAIGAPGRAVMSTVPDYVGNRNGRPDDFLRYSGTSMAAPYLAGASVLVREAYAFMGQEHVNQDTIYQLLRATADAFYDPATSQSYLRLNVHAALDAILPDDEFGSTFDTATSLGTIDSLSVDGRINTLVDTDYLTFTTAGSGTLTLRLETLRGTAPQWWVVGPNQQIHVPGGGQITLDVVAGQSYTLVVAGDGGLAQYQISSQQALSEDPAPPADTGLGAIDQVVLGPQAVHDTQWTFTASRSGILTAEALFRHTAGNVNLELYDSQGRLIASSATQTDNERLDVNVTAGAGYTLVARGSNSAVTLRITNLVSQAGGTTHVYGTAESDVLTFAAPGKISVNGVSYTAATKTVSFEGGAGVDSIELLGSKKKDQLVARPHSGQLKGGGYQADFDSIEHVRVNGVKGKDVATLYDSAGNDSLTGTKGRVTLTGVGYSVEVVNFSKVSAYASQGIDSAQLHGTSKKDKLKVTSSQTKLSGKGYNYTCYGFTAVQAYGNGGADRARLYLVPGQETFVALPQGGAITGEDFFHYLEGFKIRTKSAKTATAAAGAMSAGSSDPLRGVSGEDTSWLMALSADRWQAPSEQEILSSKPASHDEAGWAELWRSMQSFVPTTAADHVAPADDHDAYSWYHRAVDALFEQAGDTGTGDQPENEADPWFAGSPLATAADR